MKLTFLGTSAGESYPAIWCDCENCTYAREHGGKNIRMNTGSMIDDDILLDMNSRMKDLQIPFISGMIYDVRMRGSWTLKQIMSMMEDPGYSQLEIRQGMDAVFQWRQLDRDEDVNKDEIIDDLKKYCGMDSWAMVVVFKWIRECAGL